MGSLAFTEEMKGFVGFGASDYRSGWDEGRASATSFMFHLTITVDDLARFRQDPNHLARAEGWVGLGALAPGRLPVEEGWFNLFAPGLGANRTTMRYRLFFRDAGGNALTMVGFKDVGDDPGLDVWADTTSLSVSILDGHVPPATDAIGQAAEEGHAVRARGVIVIRITDFARQLTTFRAGPTDLVRFGVMFMGALWRTYCGRARKRPGR